MSEPNADASLPFPFEFSIRETPLSHQAKSGRAKSEWKERIGTAAKARAGMVCEWYQLMPQPLAVTIYYFPPDEMMGDVDNIVKCILDGMCHIVYLSDRDIERVTVQKFEPGVERSFLNVTGVLAAALAAEPPVLTIRIDSDLAWRTIA